MAFTVASAIDRLTKRKESLVGERRRIEFSTSQELTRVDAQLAAIDNVLGSLSDQAKAGTVDALLAALDKAGLRLEVAER